MSLEDNSATEVLSGKAPAPDETRAPLTDLGDDAVPLRHPADGELLREREQRVRVVTRRHRPRRFFAARGHKALALMAVGVVGIGGIVAAFVASGGKPTPDLSRPAKVSESLPSASVHDSISAKPHAAGGVAQARRRAALSARDKAARRRARQLRQRQEVGERAVRSKRVRERKGGRFARGAKSKSTPSASSVEAAAPPASDAEVPSAAEAAPQSTSEESSPPNVESAPEPSEAAASPVSSGGAAAAPAPQPSSSEQGESAAQAEFGFEK